MQHRRRLSSPPPPPSSHQIHLQASVRLADCFLSGGSCSALSPQSPPPNRVSVRRGQTEDVGDLHFLQ